MGIELPAQAATEPDAGRRQLGGITKLRAEFVRAPRSVPQVRQIAQCFLGGMPPQGAVDDVLTVVGELANNAVEHTRGEYFWVAFHRTPGACRISVEDVGPHDGEPAFPGADAIAANPEALFATSGRGLFIVATLCPGDHGARRTTAGTGFVTWGTVRWGRDA